MKCFRCIDIGTGVFCFGLGLIVSLLFTSGVLVCCLGVLLSVLGILLVRRK